MRLFEITCIPVYLYQVLFAIELLSVAMVREQTLDEANNVYLSSKCNLVDFNTFAGTSVEWLLIEVFVFGYFICTMLLTMIKSRFMRVGMDNSAQFEPTYMSYLANKVVKDVDLNMENVDLYYVNKERLIQVQGVIIKVAFGQEDFDAIKKGEVVSEKMATGWIKRCIVGSISKLDLDNERMKETNSLDMMQNSSIVYHTESILEMQMLCLITMVVLNQFWLEKKAYMTVGNGDTATLLIILLLVEHVMSYCFGIFRDYEIEKNGKPNKFGIEYAPTEFCLRIFEILVDFGLFVFIAIYFSS
jgi:hypothetical protein